MLRRRPFILISLLAVSTVPCSTLGQPVGTGVPLGDSGFRLYPWLDVLMAYESNYYKTSNDAQVNNAIEGLGGLAPLSTWENVVSPGVRLTGLAGKYTINMSYFANIGTVTASSADNFTDQQAQADVTWQPNSKNRFTFNYQYWYWHDRRGSGSPSDSSRANFFYPHPDLWDSNRVTLGYSYGTPGNAGRLDFLAGYRTRHYLNNNQEARDNDRPVLGATFYWRFRPTVALLVDAGWEKIDYTRQVPGSVTLDSDQVTAYAGVTWDATAKTSGTIKVGWLGKTFMADQRENVSDVGWSAQVQYRPVPYSTFNLVTERTPAETNTGLADAIVVSLVNLDWVHYWPYRNGRIHTRVGLLGTNDDYVGEPRTDHRYHVSGGVFYQMVPRVELGLDYTYEVRNSSVALGAGDYNDNIVLFSVRTAY